MEIERKVLQRACSGLNKALESIFPRDPTFFPALLRPSFLCDEQKLLTEEQRWMRHPMAKVALAFGMKRAGQAPRCFPRSRHRDERHQQRRPRVLPLHPGEAQ